MLDSNKIEDQNGKSVFLIMFSVCLGLVDHFENGVGGNMEHVVAKFMFCGETVQTSKSGELFIQCEIYEDSAHILWSRCEAEHFICNFRSRRTRI